MAISRMQEPQQIQSGIGSLQDPRQKYFLGKLVKKAGRAVKKVIKSPLGKAALIGAGAYFMPGFGIKAQGGFGGILKGLQSKSGFLGNVGNMFRQDGDKEKDFSMGRMLAGGLGATAIAAPFFMGGNDEEDEPVEQMDPAAVTQRAKNYYSGAGDAGVGLDFMPQKKYVMQNFYAADGGRAGYANGMLVDEDDEEEYIRSGAGQSRRQQQTFLNMGGGAGEAQAEQMLMMEYVKYKNKGGNLSFEQFVKAVMQAQQQPEGAGMEQPQPVMMAANGGPVPDSTVPGYTTPAGYNKFDYRSGGEEVRVGKADGGQLVGPSGDGSRPGYAGESDIGFLDVIKSFPSAIGQIFSGKTENMLGDNQEEKNKFMVQDMFPDMDEETLSMIVDMNNKGAGVDEISTITGQDAETITSMLSILTMKAYGGRIGKQEGGIMATDEASEMIDMGGMEKDYRNEGGFVAMGGKERADDVPARLSKNEFVFTADAVRNAGGGDIDKGAEVMENLMSNLEQGGEISEDSQGLEGAQAMYDQQQMLQSRVI